MGVMINDARQYIWTQPLQMFWPGLALFISVMAFNLVGDALRDRLDPHLIAEHATDAATNPLQNIVLQPSVRWCTACH
jgi:hypothetical protein